MNWYLEDVWEKNKAYPYTFYVPSKRVTDQLKTGDMVKLIFVDENGAERMWVKIKKRQDDLFLGSLENKPYHMEELTYGQDITFILKHICATEYEDPEASKWEYYFDTKVIVSNDVLERNEFNFLLKDDPDFEYDSGWVIFSGYEDDEYETEPDNFQIISIGAILNMDDSILSFINDEPLCAYERNVDGVFEKIEDYDWSSYLREEQVYTYESNYVKTEVVPYQEVAEYRLLLVTNDSII